MKKLAALLSLFALAAFAQSAMQDFWDPSTVSVQVVHLYPQGDGGCVAQWCGQVVGDAGTVLSACTADVTLNATVNQNRCNGLSNAGQLRLTRALNFPNTDAGAP